jgi:hypothetical protein
MRTRQSQGELKWDSDVGIGTARAAKQQARDIQQRHASVQTWLNQQGRTGLTAAELRATRIQLEAAGVPQPEVRARMRVLNQYKEPGGVRR